MLTPNCVCVWKPAVPQIRVHMAHINHPLVGDQLYGGRPRPLKGDEFHDALREFGPSGSACHHAASFTIRSRDSDGVARADSG